MAIKDVTVIIDVERPTPLLGFGKPLILGSSTEGKPYKTYNLDSLDGVKADYGVGTEEYKAAAAIYAQGDHAPKEIAIAQRKNGTEPETIDQVLARVWGEDFYFLTATTTDDAEVDAIAAYVDLENYRQFFTRSDDPVRIAAFKAKLYKRSTMFEHDDIVKYPEAALIGRCGSAPVGSLTWKGKTLAGIQPMDINGTELKAIHDRGAITYVTKAGDNVTSEGKTVSGDFIDSIHGQDYIKYSIEYEVQKLFNRAEKVPYTNAGIAQIESKVRTVLQRAAKQGLIDIVDNIPQYGTTFKSRANSDAAEIAARTYTGGEFWYREAGAIHDSIIRGQVRISA
ncbi:DUF3383 family protein [Saccharibacillus sacchari]|uniref:DUF3383 family protein n=1 Tax=Saccharibacillus sacchari TaxID=456493 RepID=A0ACC6PID4_9BACL